MTEPGGTLAEAVSAAVEHSGLTIEQIAAATRIRGTLIRDLCAGRTASSGGDVYARGHLRAIAQTTGADPEPLLAALARESGVPQPDPVVTATVEVAGLRAGSLALPRARKPERRGPQWGVGVSVALLLLVGIILVGTWRGGAGGGPVAQPSTQPSVTTTGAPAPAPSETENPVGPDAVASLPAVSGAALRVRVIGGSSWVLVSNATTKLFEGVLPDGTVKDFADPAGLQVKVGNAGAISLICGGKDVPAGGSGQVKTFSCAPTGLAPV